ncbi:hypothetical protein [Microbulbifer taiwanensis]|uniref:hypothetical protein n=1 Tax=Microbulbifer taiwanensis TaxID=986746 RepID=UPI0036214D8C
MKTVWLVCLAALVACGRPEAPRSGSGDSGPTTNGAALSPAEPRPAAPEQEPLSVPGVERLVDLRGGAVRRTMCRRWKNLCATTRNCR